MPVTREGEVTHLLLFLGGDAKAQALAGVVDSRKTNSTTPPKMPLYF
jgi:hypothetical protein